MRFCSTKLGRHVFPSGSIGQEMLVLLGLVSGGALCLSLFGPLTWTSAKPQAAQCDLEAYTYALKFYKGESGGYPTTQQGLNALAVRPTKEPIPARWTRAVDRTKPDPWGSEYVYQFPGTKNPEEFDLTSKGPDGNLGTSDDIRNN